MLTPTVILTVSVQFPHLSLFSFFIIDSHFGEETTLQSQLSGLQRSCIVGNRLKTLTLVFLTPKLVVVLDHIASHNNKIIIIVIATYIYQVLIPE